MSARFVSILVVFALLASREARAEVIGPLLPRGSFEAGVQGAWIHRDVYYGNRESEWQQGWIFGAARWGITEAATISIEGSRNLGGLDHKVTVDGKDQKVDLFYVGGGAVQAALWRNRDITVSGAFQFTVTMLRIENDAVRNVTTETYGGQIVAQYDTRLLGTAFTAWGGPAFSKFYPTYEQDLDSTTRTFYTNSDWGVVFGFGVLLWEHVDLTGHVLWVENPQPRAGLSYRF